MAILNTYTFDNVSWTKHDWSIGEIISEGKFDNVENGIAISISLADTILREIGGQLDPGTSGQIILNSSRIDNLTTWITGSAAGSYTGTTISTRLTNIDSDINTLETNEKQLRNYITGSNTGTYINNDSISERIDNLESKGSAIATEIWGSDTTTGTSRLDTVIDKEKELRIYLTGTNTGTYSGTALITRLNTVETEIWGSTTTSGNSKIDALETAKTNIIKAIAGTNGTLVYNSNIYGRLTTLETKEKQLRNYITGSDTGEYSETAIDTRLDTLETFMAATKTKIGGWNTSSFSNNTYLDKVINEVWSGNNGTGTTFTSDSRIDSIQKWITGSISGSYNQNITATTGYIEARLNYLEAEVGGSLNSDSRIDNAIEWITGDKNSTYPSNKDDVNTRLNSLEGEIASMAALEATSAALSLVDSEIIDYYEEHDNGILHRVNDLESLYNSISVRQGVSTEFRESLSIDITNPSVEILHIDDPIGYRQIVFIKLNHAIPGNKPLKIQFNVGSAYNAIYKYDSLGNNINVQIPMSKGTIIGAYRIPSESEDTLILFNLPTIL